MPIDNPRVIPISLTSEISGVLPIANGGTNSSAALNNGRQLKTSSGAIVEVAATNAQTGTTYTLTNDDFGRLITFNNASAITVTLPQQSALTDLTTSFFCIFRNLGAGTITFVKQGSETLTGNTIAAQGAWGFIRRPAAASWVIDGGTAIVNETGMGQWNGSVSTSQTALLWKAMGNCTLLNIHFRASVIGTAGTFKLQYNGVDITGLTGLIPATSTTAASPSAAVTMYRGDEITIVTDGTMVNVTNLTIVPDITVTY